jgi:hypothetical protein
MEEQIIGPFDLEDLPLGEFY